MLLKDDRDTTQMPLTYETGQEFVDLDDVFTNFNDWIGRTNQFANHISFGYSGKTNRIIVNVDKGFHLYFNPGNNGVEEWYRNIGLPKEYIGVDLTDVGKVIDLEPHRTPIPYTLAEPLLFQYSKFKGNKIVWKDEADESTAADEPPRDNATILRIKEGNYTTVKDLVDEINNEIEKFDTKSAEK